MEFRNTGQTDTELKTKIQRLFDDAKDQWKGVFPEYSTTYELSESHLSVCVSSLQDVKLFNSNLQIVDEAFEYLVGKSAKGEKGQYFTPRHVIDMCVKMLNPKRGESMIDTASGSCGFPVHTIFKLTGTLFTNAEIPPEDKEHVLKVFGIDFDERTVRVARTLNLIAGDGETNVLHLNTLDYERWSDNTERNNRWVRTYGDGFDRLKALRTEPEENKLFNFDILMANPPLLETSRNAAFSTNTISVLKRTVKHKAKSDAIFSLLSEISTSSNPVDAWRLSSHKADSTIPPTNTFAILSRNMPVSWLWSDWTPILSNPIPAPTQAFYLCKSGMMTLPKVPFALKLRTTTSFSLSPKKAARIIQAITFFSKIAMGNTS